MALTAYGGKAFTQFAELTGPTIFTSNKDVINDAQKTNYGTLGYMLRGQQMSDVLRGGSNIQDRVYLSATNKDISYLPGQDISYSISETGTQWSAGWRFFLNYIAWSDEAVMLNSGGSRSSKEARFHAYKDYWFELQQNLHTDQMNAWESRMWAVPDSATMEASGAKEMFSIPVFITENDSGQHALESDGSTQYNGGGTVAGIDPDTHAKWANHVETYPSATGFTVGSITNVLQKLDLAYKSTDFRPPPMSKEYFENPQKAQRPMPWIACSKTGHSQLIYLYRESKDRWVDMKDPFFTPTYAGAPVVYVGELDTAALYDVGSSLATESAATKDGPRYYGIQPQYLRMVFHEDRYFESLGTFTDKSQPTTHVMPINTWGQLVPRSRARHFIIAPAD